MGTIGDWEEIVTIAVIAGLYGWVRDMGHKPYPKLGRSLAGWLLLTTALGIWLTLRWRAFSVPLVFITVPVAVGAVILQYFARPRGAQRAAAELSADHHK